MLIPVSVGADGVDNPASGGKGNSVAAGEGIDNLGIGGSTGGGTTPCTGGQADFSDATGCNTVTFMVIWR